MQDYRELYKIRFNKFERIKKQKLWKIFCRIFLQQFINKKNDLVLDIGAGSCEFINNIQCRGKWAIDGDPNFRKNAFKNVKTIVGKAHQVKTKIHKKFDIIFLSNLLEHLDSKEEVFKFLFNLKFLLKRNGKILLMQPDIKRVGMSYWDFFDHKVALTEKSLIEVFEALDYKIIFKISPFLPYSTKVGFPLWEFLLIIYLKLRPLHYIFGKQFFLIAQYKPIDK